MDVLYLLLPVCLFLGALSLVLFLWAARSGQFDDTKTPAIRMLFDDENEFNPKGKDSTKTETTP